MGGSEVDRLFETDQLAVWSLALLWPWPLVTWNSEWRHPDTGHTLCNTLVMDQTLVTQLRFERHQRVHKLLLIIWGERNHNKQCFCQPTSYKTKSAIVQYSKFSWESLKSELWSWHTHMAGLIPGTQERVSSDPLSDHAQLNPVAKYIAVQLQCGPGILPASLNHF